MFEFTNRTQIARLPEPNADSVRRSTVLGRDGPDPAEQLPAAAAAKLRALRDVASDLSAWASAPYQRAKELRIDAESVQRRISELRRAMRRPDDENALLQAELDSLASVTTEMQRLQAMAAERRERAAAASRLVGRIESYARTYGKSISLAPAVAAPAVPKNSTVEVEVDKIRGRIVALHEDAQTTADAPVHAETAKRLARDFVYGIASRGSIDVFPTVESARLPTLPQLGGQIVPAGSDATDTLSLLFWVLRDEIVAKLEDEITEIADDESALSDEQRRVRIADAKSKILDLERTEEAIIVAAARDGVVIDRRADADVRAVLGVNGPEPRPD
jgi:hypothetical protein